MAIKLTRFPAASL